MGGGKSGGANREAERARQEEQARQARIREGTQRINSIFDGRTVGANPLTADAQFDPTATYYLEDGSEWNGQKTPTNFGEAFMSIGNLLKPGMGRGQQFETLARSGKLFTSRKQEGGFNEDFFKGREQAFLDYANPQLESQYGDAQKELTFALARGGLLDSSVRGEKAGDLQERYGLQKQQVADQALSYGTEARNAVEDARANLIATLNATGDAQGAANAALARSTALSRPQQFSPLSNLFADFTSGLGTQAALERANAYGAGPAPRYNTGLFAPRQNSVQVT